MPVAALSPYRGLIRQLDHFEGHHALAFCHFSCNDTSRQLHSLSREIQSKQIRSPLVQEASPGNRRRAVHGALGAGALIPRETVLQIDRNRVLIGIENRDPGRGRSPGKGCRSVEDSGQDNPIAGLADGHTSVQLRECPGTELKEGPDLAAIARQFDPGRFVRVAHK